MQPPDLAPSILGIADVVVVLGEAVAAARAPLLPHEQWLRDALCAMPQHRAAGDLGAWKEAYQTAVPDSDTPTRTETLLDAVFDFGRCNLYGAFDLARTASEFKQVVDALREQGVGILHLPVPRHG